MAWLYKHPLIEGSVFALFMVAALAGIVLSGCDKGQSQEQSQEQPQDGVVSLHDSTGFEQALVLSSACSDGACFTAVQLQTGPRAGRTEQLKQLAGERGDVITVSVKYTLFPNGTVSSWDLGN